MTRFSQVGNKEGNCDMKMVFVLLWESRDHIMESLILHCYSTVKVPLILCFVHECRFDGETGKIVYAYSFLLCMCACKREAHIIIF